MKESRRETQRSSRFDLWILLSSWPSQNLLIWESRTHAELASYFHFFCQYWSFLMFCRWSLLAFFAGSPQYSCALMRRKCDSTSVDDIRSQYFRQSSKNGDRNPVLLVTYWFCMPTLLFSDIVKLDSHDELHLTPTWWTSESTSMFNIKGEVTVLIVFWRWGLQVKLVVPRSSAIHWTAFCELSQWA